MRHKNSRAKKLIAVKQAYRQSIKSIKHHPLQSLGIITFSAALGAYALLRLKNHL